ALDERTPDHRMERRQLSQERQPSLTQNPGRIPAPTLRTSHLRGLISYRACFVNVFVTTLDAFEQLGERPQLVEAHDQARRALEMGVGRGLRPVRPLFRDGERAAGTTSKDQALNAGETPTLKHSKALLAQWMEEMRNLGPSPLLAGLRCSGQWASGCRAHARPRPALKSPPASPAAAGSAPRETPRGCATSVRAGGREVPDRHPVDAGAARFCRTRFSAACRLRRSHTASIPGVRFLPSPVPSRRCARPSRLHRYSRTRTRADSGSASMTVPRSRALRLPCRLVLGRGIGPGYYDLC